MNETIRPLCSIHFHCKKGEIEEEGVKKEYDVRTKDTNLFILRLKLKVRTIEIGSHLSVRWFELLMSKLQQIFSSYMIIRPLKLI